VRLARQWKPRHYDLDQWLDLAAEAGMRYVCFTTKHHDGFCLWDTRQTAFNTMNTPYGRDVLAMLADAGHRRRMPLCRSIADWTHPCYPKTPRPVGERDDPRAAARDRHQQPRVRRGGLRDAGARVRRESGRGVGFATP